jgi:DNA-binding NarL/FixJ family response regulator
MTCELEPDIVLLDIAMPLLNGLEATRRIHRDCPHARVLILSMHENEEYIRQVLASGAMGYILKDAGAEELVSAIRTVQRGEAVLSPAITRLVIEDYLRWGDLQPQNTSNGLTPREREIRNNAEGYSNRSDILHSIKRQAHRTNRCPN